MTHTSTYDTWQKCVRLSKDTSTTPHERAAAAAKAKQLYTRLEADGAFIPKLSEADLEALSDADLKARLKVLEKRHRKVPFERFSDLQSQLRDVRWEIRRRRRQPIEKTFKKMSEAELWAWKPSTMTKGQADELIRLLEDELRARFYSRLRSHTARLK